MAGSEQFSFRLRGSIDNEAGYMPYVPLRLNYQNRTIETEGLVDTGATVNVLPYSIGLSLGAIWQNQPSLGQLAGNLARTETRAMSVTIEIGSLQPTAMLFAWASIDTVPVILGQVNFFMEFDVCFFRSQKVFEIKLR